MSEREERAARDPKGSWQQIIVAACFSNDPMITIYKSLYGFPLIKRANNLWAPGTLLDVAY